MPSEKTRQRNTVHTDSSSSKLNMGMWRRANFTFTFLVWNLSWLDRLMLVAFDVVWCMDTMSVCVCGSQSRTFYGMECLSRFQTTTEMWRGPPEAGKSHWRTKGIVLCPEKMAIKMCVVLVSLSTQLVYFLNQKRHIFPKHFHLVFDICVVLAFVAVIQRHIEYAVE